MKLVEKILHLHRELDVAEIPHAFGGALAMAWCTQQARGTIDIDINLFIEASEAESVLAELPRGIEISQASEHRILRR